MIDVRSFPPCVEEQFMRPVFVSAIAVGVCLALPLGSAAATSSIDGGAVGGATATHVGRAYGPAPFPAPTSVPGLSGGHAPSGAVEPVPRYVAQTSCDPRQKPGIAAFKKLVMAQYPSGKDWGSVRNCTDDGISEHLEGRAWDWNVNVKNATQFAQAAQLLTWLTDNDGYNARRLGIMYIGYNARIWGAYRASEGWRPLSNSNPHTDHVHFSFTWNGAMKKTSFWTGSTPPEDYGPCRPYAGQPAPIWNRANPTPCPIAPALPASLRGAKLLWRGSKGSKVTRVQQKVKRGARAEAGVFGPKTANAVRAYQRAKGLPVTGAVDAATWFALRMNIKPKK